MRFIQFSLLSLFFISLVFSLSQATVGISKCVAESKECIDYNTMRICDMQGIPSVATCPEGYVCRNVSSTAAQCEKQFPFLILLVAILIAIVGLVCIFKHFSYSEGHKAPHSEPAHHAHKKK